MTELFHFIIGLLITPYNKIGLQNTITKQEEQE